MKFKKVAFCVALCTTVFPFQANAIEVVGKKLEIYGKIHMSVDVSDEDGASNDDGLSVSSNSSRLGFKGEIPAGDVSFVYQMEQEVRLDDTSGGTFATRNTYAGIKGSAGKLILGHHDTPFKTIGSKWGIFGDSVGERRAILGAGYVNGNQLNERARNAIMYEYKNKKMTFQALHAVDPEGASGSNDDTDNKVTSIGVLAKLGGFHLGAAVESWDNHSRMADGDATRLSATYKFGFGQVGAIWENIDSDSVAEWQRDVIGVNALFKVSKSTDIRVQYHDADGTTATGASKLGLGVFHKLDKSMKVYAAYGATDNDANADFKAVDGGHGDEVGGPVGGNPSSVSVGFEYKF